MEAPAAPFQFTVKPVSVRGENPVILGGAGPVDTESVSEEVDDTPFSVRAVIVTLYVVFGFSSVKTAEIVSTDKGVTAVPPRKNL